jgi:AraC-like DNA-binding protein
VSELTVVDRLDDLGEVSSGISGNLPCLTTVSVRVSGARQAQLAGYAARPPLRPTRYGNAITQLFASKFAITCQRFVPPRWSEVVEPQIWILMWDSLVVRESDADNPETFPTAMGTLTRLAYERAKREGVNVDSLVREAGLTQQRIDDPNARLEVKSQIRFLELAATTLKDECLGFHLTQKFDLRVIGLLHYVLASSDKLAEALRRGARYSAVVNEGIALKVREGDEIAINFEYVGIPRHSDRHQIESFMVTLVRACRQLTNRHLLASRVSFIHRRGGDTSEFNAFFGCDVTFGAAVDEVAFSNSIGQLPIVGADPYLNELLLKYCQEALAERPTTRSSFVSGVENVIVGQLPHGKARAGEIARKLGVSQRTLARRLSSEGLTFAGVMQRLKSDLAKRHLADGTLSISEIAWLLGYQDVSAFTHAFKRWTGKAPRAIRQALR